MNKMAIQQMVEFMHSDEWILISDDLRSEWIKNFYQKAKLEITTAYMDGKYKSEGYENSEDYIKQNFEI
jgi:hypothetical protein